MRSRNEEFVRDYPRPPRIELVDGNLNINGDAG